MDAADFALEFSQLLMRYTTPKKTTNEKTEETDISKLSSGIPLSSETIIKVVQDTLSTIIPEPYVPTISISCNKTPGNDIIINTPDAPFVQRVTINGNGIISECTDNLSNKLSPMDKKNASPPKFNLINSGRSDTFVQDDEKNTDNPNNEIFKEITDDFFFEGENLPSYVRLKLDGLRKSAVEVISKIDEIKTINKDCKQPSMEKSLRPIRRLSSIGPYPRSLLRSEQQPLKKRRSFINFQNTTPTSSRLNNTLTLSPNLSKRKSSSSTSLNVTTAATVLTKPTINSNVRSRSSLSAGVLKKSPLSDGRPAKNPKYAHIQSSIPKPTPIIKRT